MTQPHEHEQHPRPLIAGSASAAIVRSVPERASRTSSSPPQASSIAPSEDIREHEVPALGRIWSSAKSQIHPKSMKCQ